MKNDFIKALLKQPIDRRPVWMMRQAGRYLPEYRELRTKAKDFLEFCKTPSMAVEATLQPLARFDLDAAIIFSDILTIVDAYQIGLKFVTQVGPVVENPVRDVKAIEALPRLDVADLSYVAKAIEQLKPHLSVPLIGFAGSPWTVATYMVEGGSSKTFKHIKTLMYREPAALHALLTKLTNITVDYLNMQIEAGADVVQIFDSWGGVLTTDTYQEFSLAYMRKILAGLKASGNESVPVILFTKGGGNWLESLANSGCQAVGLDWTVELAQARNRIGDQVALQGNLDPFALYGAKETLTETVKRLCKVYGRDTGYVFNLGHGIDKDTPIEHVELMIETIRSQW